MFLEHNVQNVSLPENSSERLLNWSQFRKGQALRRKGNKVEVLEGKFRTLKLLGFVSKKKTNFLPDITRPIKTAMHVFEY